MAEDGRLPAQAWSVVEVWAPAEGPIDRFSSDDADIRWWGPGRYPGYYRLMVKPNGSGQTLTAFNKAGSIQLPLNTSQVPASPLRLKVPTRAMSGDRAVNVAVIGALEEFPTALRCRAMSQLWVEVTEGEATLTCDDATGDIGILWNLGDARSARYAVVTVGRRGVREIAASAQLPISARVVWRTELGLDYAGTQVRAFIGNRIAGKSLVDEEGRFVMTIVQRPGERVARFERQAKGGAVMTQPVELPSSRGSGVFGYPTGAWAPAVTPPLLLLGGVTADGRSEPWSTVTCESQDGDLLAIQESSSGGAWLSLPPLTEEMGFRYLIDCRGDGIDTQLEVRPKLDRPAALNVSVWPEQLTADFPVGQVRVGVLNGFSQAIQAPPQAQVTINAGLGEMQPASRSGAFWVAEYRGELAVEVGRDALNTTMKLPLSSGPVARIQVMGQSQSAEGVAVVHIRTADDLGASVPGVPLLLTSQGDSEAPRIVESGPDGLLTLSIPQFEGPEGVLHISSGGVNRSLAIADGLRFGSSLPQALLSARTPLSLDAGRAVELGLSVTPQRFEVWPGRSLDFELRLKDQEGQALTDADRVEVSASRGRIERLDQEEEDSLTMRYSPAPGMVYADVDIRAVYEDLDLEEQTVLEVRPRRYRGSVGIGGGIVTNFAALSSPLLSLDTTWNIPMGKTNPDARTQALLRAGLDFYVFRDELVIPDSLIQENTMYILPFEFSILLRSHWRRHSLIIGPGAKVAPYYGLREINGQPYSKGWGVLDPALAVTVGYGFRMVTGELFVDVRANTLVGDGAVNSVTGALGGLAFVGGYRVIF